MRTQRRLSFLALTCTQTLGEVQSALRDGPETVLYNFGNIGRAAFREKTDELLRIFAALLFALVPMVGAAQSTTEHDIALYAMGNYTTTSLGKESNDSSAFTQSNKAAIGAAGYFESWKRKNGLVFGGSYTKTDSQLNTVSWALKRYKADAVYERRFWGDKAFQPYLGLGGFLVILWGGYAPAHSNVNASGLDSLAGVVVPVGITARLTPIISFKLGLFLDIGKASSYGDPNYTSSQNLMYEPQIGLSFKIGNKNNLTGERLIRTAQLETQR